MKKLNIWLKPFGDRNYQVKYFDVKIDVEDLSLENGEAAALLWKTVAGVPACELDKGYLYVEDAKGSVPLSFEMKEEMAGFSKRIWRVCRETSGNLCLSYRFFPRDLTEVKRAHPLFDVCNEPMGVTMSGVTCLAEVKDGQYEITVDWDLSQMPEGTAVAAIHEGTWVGRPKDYAFSLYALGKVSCCLDETGKYRMIWLTDPLPEKERICEIVPVLVRELCRFFGDEEIGYSVFFRKDPFDNSNGGTAFDGGFIYGYSDAQPLGAEQSINTLAHEIIHNWPRMENNAGEGNWFNEGTAEYYSVVLPYRAGIISREQMKQQLKEKLDRYLENPCRCMSNEEAHRMTWENKEAQKLPYGRGLCYLIDTQEKIRGRSGGSRSVDDLVLILVNKRKRGEKVTSEDWEQLIRKELGEEAVVNFRRIMNGKELVPAEEWYEGTFAEQN